ncbi:MAG: NTP transferase domain-containing protein [Bacteroidetes bacterium]|jgi:NDP-mannose synthase|nr:NTP transferase domain-containing protein [Bacteroidota bacterium]MBT7995287.1 NTP transferase domain-containing protein [Bacteroidota bacterium]
MKAVILAGGLGARLKPFTEVIPKPLLPVGEKAILEIQLERLKEFGFDEVFLATNYKSEYIENFFGDGSRYGVKLKISKEKERLGTAGPLKLIQKHLPDPFIVMNGDILSLIDFGKIYNFANQQDSLLTIAIKKIVTPFAFGNIFFEGDRVTDIQEKPDFVTYIFAGIYVVKPELLKMIPENQNFGMDELMKLMLKQNLPITKYEMDEYWLDIGRVEDYEKAQIELKNNFNNK